MHAVLRNALHGGDEHLGFSWTCRAWPSHASGCSSAPRDIYGAVLQISQHRLTGAALIHLDSEPIEAYTFRNGVLRSSTPIAWKTPTGQTVEVGHPCGWIGRCQHLLPRPATADSLKGRPLTAGCAVGPCPVPSCVAGGGPSASGLSTGSPHTNVFNCAGPAGSKHAYTPTK